MESIVNWQPVVDNLPEAGLIVLVKDDHNEVWIGRRRPFSGTCTSPIQLSGYTNWWLTKEFFPDVSKTNWTLNENFPAREWAPAPPIDGPIRVLLRSFTRPERQAAVTNWALECFGAEETSNIHHRALRLLEESIEAY